MMWVASIAFAAGMAFGIYFATHELREVNHVQGRADVHKECRSRIAELEQKVEGLREELQKVSNWWVNGEDNPLGDCSY